MKNVKIKKETWRELCQIKSKRNLSNLPKVIEYLINSQHVLKGESLQEIHRRVDELIKAKNLEENLQYDDNLGFLCLQCGQPFKFKWSDQDETEGLQCPNCGFLFNILSFEEN